MALAMESLILAQAGDPNGSAEGYFGKFPICEVGRSP